MPDARTLGVAGGYYQIKARWGGGSEGRLGHYPAVTTLIREQWRTPCRCPLCNVSLQQAGLSTYCTLTEDNSDRLVNTYIIAICLQCQALVSKYE